MSRPYEPSTDLAVRHELAESLRIPLLSSPYPSWFYVTGIVVSDLWFGQMPTDAEIRAVASFAEEYRLRWYNPTWIDRMRERAPFDIDGGANGTFFFKYEHGGWAYQKRTWSHGARPQLREEPMSLLAVMDRCHSYGGAEPYQPWERWKADHADVFAALAGTAGRPTPVHKTSTGVVSRETVWRPRPNGRDTFQADPASWWRCTCGASGGGATREEARAAARRHREQADQAGE